MLTLAFALSVLGILLMKLEFPALAGPLYASGAQERWSVKLLLPLLVLGTLGLPFFLEEPYGETLAATLPSTEPHTVAIIVLGAAAAVGVSAVIHPRTSVPYAFMGAFMGYRFMADGTLDGGFAGGVVLSWLAAPVVCAALTFLLSKITVRYATRPGRHLAVVDQHLLSACVAASLLMAVASAWNMGQLATLFPRMMMGAGLPSALVCLAFLAAAFLFRAKPSLEDDTDFGSCSALSVMLAMAATFALFSWSGVGAIGLTPTPISASSLMVAGLVGVSLAQKNAMIEGKDILQSTAAALAAPVLGFLITYCLSMVLSTLILAGIIAMVAALYIYVRAQRAEVRRTEMLRSREEQVYSTQKSLSALEVRVETQEKVLLTKLENKRKELVDFAVGVSEQKAFMEKVYNQLEEARALPEGARREEALDGVLNELRERMYFTREISDFYARTEILHRDFNTRLKEAFPDLTESERKLANLLRQGFSSKYIASLMNITPKSVEISRYRLRNKLGLKRSDNLVQYIKSI